MAARTRWIRRARAVADRPVIFSAPMVRALLAGTKSQTRRLIRDEVRDPPAMENVHPEHEARHPEPYLDAYCGQPRTAANPRGMSDRWCWWTRDDRCCLPQFKVGFVPGDRLWVRESFVHYYELDGDDQPCGELLTCYRADGWPLAGWYDRDREETRDAPPWRSPIHMPRALSRLTLTVTEVRVQRLQDISEEDAIAEGATMRPKCRGFRNQYDGWSMDWSQVGKPSRFGSNEGRLDESDVALSSATSAFGAFINELHDPRWNLKGDGIWGENPWCAAISFSTTPANIDSLPETGGRA